MRAEVVESARLESAGKLAAARAGEILAELEKGAAWPAAAARWTGEAATQAPKPAGRQDAGLPTEVRDAAFRAPLADGKPRYGVATLANGDTALWTVTAVQKGQLSAKTADEKRTAQDEARDRVAMSDATVYITTMRANADIDVNPQLFE